MPRSIVVALVLAAAPALAAEEDALRLGETVARAWCADCHAMPDASGAATDTASSFAAIARSEIEGAGFLRALADPHPAMPDPGLSREQVDAVWAWVESLRR